MQSSLFLINAGVVPFVPYADEGIQYSGTYTLNDNEILYVGREQQDITFGRTEQGEIHALSFRAYDGLPVWAGWYDLPNGDTLFKDHEGVLYLWQPRPDVDLTSE